MGLQAQGEKTVVVSAESGEQLEELADFANQLLLPTFLVRLSSWLLIAALDFPEAMDAYF